MSTNQPKDEFFENRNDDSEWGAPIRVSKKKKTLSAMVSIRFSSEEFEIIQNAASNLSMTISAYVREAVIDKTRATGFATQLKTGTGMRAPWAGTFSSSLINIENPAARANLKNQIDLNFKVS